MNDLFVMNMKRKILFVCLSFLALLQGWAQHIRGTERSV